MSTSSENTNSLIDATIDKDDGEAPDKEIIEDDDDGILTHSPLSRKKGAEKFTRDLQEIQKKRQEISGNDERDAAQIALNDETSLSDIQRVEQVSNKLLELQRRHKEISDRV